MRGFWALDSGGFGGQLVAPDTSGLLGRWGVAVGAGFGAALRPEGSAGRSLCLSTSVPLPFRAAANEVRNDVSRHGFSRLRGTSRTGCAHRNDVVRHPRRINRNDLMRHAERCHRTRHPSGHHRKTPSQILRRGDFNFSGPQLRPAGPVHRADRSPTEDAQQHIGKLTHPWRLRFGCGDQPGYRDCSAQFCSSGIITFVCAAGRRFSVPRLSTTMSRKNPTAKAITTAAQMYPNSGVSQSRWAT